MLLYSSAVNATEVLYIRAFCTSLAFGLGCDHTDASLHDERTYLGVECAQDSTLMYLILQ